jgi:hypothetical protein
LNLRADPRAFVHVEGEVKPVRSREAHDEEAARLWELYFERLPAAADFRRLAAREVPIFVLEPVLQ